MAEMRDPIKDFKRSLAYKEIITISLFTLVAIIISLVSSVPFLAVAPLLSGWSLVAVLAIGGFLLQSTVPVNVTFGQTIAPISVATVSTLIMGFAWCRGGLIVPFAADLTPALTTVRVPYEELGRTAVRLALDREVGFASDNHVVLSTQLVIRDSVRPAAD